MGVRKGSGMVYYWLDDNWEPQPVKDVLEWAKRFESGSRVLRYTEIGRGRIITGFMGVDLGFTLGKRPPVLWETALIDIRGIDDVTTRFDSKKAAIEGHESIVKIVLHRWKMRNPGQSPRVREEKDLYWPLGKTLAEVTGRA